MTEVSSVPAQVYRFLTGFASFPSRPGYFYWLFLNVTDALPSLIATKNSAHCTVSRWVCEDIGNLGWASTEERFWGVQLASDTEPKLSVAVDSNSNLDLNLNANLNLNVYLNF